MMNKQIFISLLAFYLGLKVWILTDIWWVELVAIIISMLGLQYLINEDI